MRMRYQYGLSQDDLMAAHAVSCELDRLPYICRRILMIEDILRQLEQMRLTVSSPRIKSSDEAAYQKSPVFSENSQSVEMFLRSVELEAEEQALITDWHRIERRIQALTDEELELIILRYEYRYSYDSMAEIVGYSRESVRRHLNLALLKMAKISLTGGE